MAYNYFNPYQQYFNPQPTTPQSNSIVWVQGEAGAKSYLVGAGQSALLMDSEDSVFYIKSTDASGMPMPLRTFEYKERTNNAQNAPNLGEQNKKDINSYITREEFEKRLSELKFATTEAIEEDK